MDLSERASQMRLSLSRDLKKVTVEALDVSGRTAFQEEGTASAKGPEVGVCHVCLSCSKEDSEIRRRRGVRSLENSEVPRLRGLWERLRMQH